MVRIIVAFAADEQCAQYASVLEKAGMPVFGRCTSAAEVRRMMNRCGDAVIVAACRLPDGTADELAWDLGRRAVILCVGRPAQLELCEHPELFKLSAPCSKGEVTSAIGMLLQMHQMRQRRRTNAEDEKIARAKEILMARCAMTEPEAHRRLQKGAMDSGMKLTDYAAKIMEIHV